MNDNILYGIFYEQKHKESEITYLTLSLKDSTLCKFAMNKGTRNHKINISHYISKIIYFMFCVIASLVQCCHFASIYLSTTKSLLMDTLMAIRRGIEQKNGKLMGTLLDDERARLFHAAAVLNIAHIIIIADSCGRYVSRVSCSREMEGG